MIPKKSSCQDVPIINGQCDACSRSCSVCVRAGGARRRLDHPIQRPDDPPHAQRAPCTQSTHQPRHPAQPARGRSDSSDAVQLRLGRALRDGRRGGERRRGATATVAAT